MRSVFSRFGLIVCILSVFILLNNGCSTEAPKTPAEVTVEAKPVDPSEPIFKGNAPTIEIKANGPADTVRAFYEALREKRFRQAIFLTNLRPAVEGLTDDELKEFQLDFESIAKYVPAQLEINGEITSGNKATVTAKLPNEDLDKEEIQQIKLRKQNDVWIIQTVDESAEKKIKQQGKNYFPALRIETHQDDAREMLDRVAKAQMAFSATNQGLYGDMNALINAHFLPEDIRSSESTGYLYTVSVSSDRHSYSAEAVPAVYGKSGKLSFKVEQDAKGQAHLTSRDGGARAAK
ncbi:MAG: hypothetical protein DMF63_00330 [Acidobacteria bacterium]|nr:MAG: hypothetical protein DMF63_00330 [Acidobacteriota bacterium]